MFEEAIVKAPRSDVAELYVKYAKAEEQFGLSRHAVTVYERACAAVQDSDKLDMFRLCIRKVEQFCGITKTRPVYEKAVAELLNNNTVVAGGLTCSSVSLMCLEYAEMERKLGEIDRARAIYQHGSQFVDTRRDPIHYWNSWKIFEETHGNEDTFRDMLRVKRSVEVAFSQVTAVVAMCDNMCDDNVCDDCVMLV